VGVVEWLCTSLLDEVSISKSRVHLLSNGMARYKLCKNKKIIKNKVLLPQVYVSLVDFGYPVRLLFFMLPKLLNNLFGFPIF
jgi:hypothetical protein